MADRLRIAAGDNVMAIETDRGILLTPYDPTTEEALEIAAQAARQSGSWRRLGKWLKSMMTPCPMRADPDRAAGADGTAYLTT